MSRGPGSRRGRRRAESSRRRGDTRALRVFAVAALVIASPVLFAIGRELERVNKLVWLALIFPALSWWILGASEWRGWCAAREVVAWLEEKLTANEGA